MMLSEVNRVKRISSFLNDTRNVLREEQVIHAYTNLLGITSLARPFESDGLHSDTLFEFKFDLTLNSKTVAARCLAQASYYLRRFVYEGVYKNRLWSVPLCVAVCDRDEAFVVPVARLKEFIITDVFDWTRAPSAPDPALISAISGKSNPVIHKMTSVEGVSAFLAEMDTLASNEALRVLKTINRDNFDSIFEVWRDQFSQGLEPQEAALVYVLDLQLKRFINEAL